MTKTAPLAKIPADVFLDELSRGAIGAKVHQEIAARRLAERTKLAKQLAASEDALLAELPDLDLGIDRALEAVRDAETALADAMSTLQISRGAKASAIFECERLAHLYGNELRAGASSAVAEFRRWLRDEIDSVKRRLIVHREIKQTIGGPVEFVESNRDQIAARQTALLAVLRDEIQKLEIEPDDAAVAARIEEIRGALPIIGPAPAKQERPQ